MAPRSDSRMQVPIGTPACNSPAATSKALAPVCPVRDVAVPQQTSGTLKTPMPSTSANRGYCRLVAIVPAIGSGFTESRPFATIENPCGGARL
jgi:hypothetical protein